MLRAVVLTRSKLAKRVNVTFPFTRIFPVFIFRSTGHAYCRPPTLPAAVSFYLSYQHFFCPLPSLFSFSPFLFLHFFCCVLRKCCEKLFDKQFSARFSLSPLPRCHWPAWACQSARKSRYSVAIFSVLAWAGLGCCWRHKNANFLIGFLSDHMRWQGGGGGQGRGQLERL